MAYGFKSVAALGHKQIDADYSNLIVVQSGTATIKAQWGVMKSYMPFLNNYTTQKYTQAVDKGCNNILYSPVTVYSRYWCGLVTINNPTTQMPMVAIRPQGNNSWNFINYRALDTNSNGKYDTIEIAAGGYYADIGFECTAADATATIGYVDYIVLSLPTTLTKSSDTYGMRLYDGSGNLTFDTGHDYMKILKTQTFSGIVEGASNHTAYSYTPVSSNSYYMLQNFCYSQTPFTQTFGGDYFMVTYFICRALRKTTGGVITLEDTVQAKMVGCTGIDTYWNLGGAPTLIELDIT